MQRSALALFFLGIAALGLYSVYPSGAASYPYQTFSESLTTVGTLTVTWAEGTVTLGSVCGNVPWDMNNLTEHCSMLPVPEYIFTQLVLLVGCLLVIVTLEVYWWRTEYADEENCDCHQT